MIFVDMKVLNITTIASIMVSTKDVVKPYYKSHHQLERVQFVTTLLLQKMQVLTSCAGILL